MTKKAYVYERVDDCGSGAYHSEGGLLIVTDGYPEDAVSTSVGNRFTVVQGDREEEHFGLPTPTLVYPVADDEPDRVIVFPDSGCC